MKFLMQVSFGILFAGSCFAIDQEILAFHQVKSGVYRSGRLTEKAVVRLAKEFGVKTIINLENSKSDVKDESVWAQNNGITQYAVPMGSWRYPQDAQVEKILHLLSDPRLQPILIHCQHGEDRTGLMIGLSRVYLDHWTPAAAYQEMLDLGFHKLLFILNHYFEEKTGFED